MAFANHIRSFETDLVQWARGQLDAMRVDRARRDEYRQTLDELRQLSDRDLADLGIARCDIPRLAHATAYGA